MVNDEEMRARVADELGRTLFKIDATINLLYGGKVIPAHEKLQGIKKILLNLRGQVVEGFISGETKSDE